MEQVDQLGTITIMKDGKEVECEVLFTFENDELKKQYIGYTDHSIGENGRKNIYVSSWNPVLGTDKLEDITTQEELDMVRDVLNQIADEV
ncbi:MAG TPA: DUF1292 domain-containing protein [Candidatus Faecimonas intestinavium]|jgi:uncharacterized protein YrzB (UPF0473 family)|nr:DUF1292 domain-containing protein [Candidatus Faecimonas intestinavium]